MMNPFRRSTEMVPARITMPLLKGSSGGAHPPYERRTSYPARLPRRIPVAPHAYWIVTGLISDPVCWKAIAI
jgi:hypothetical protein